MKPAFKLVLSLVVLLSSTTPANGGLFNRPKREPAIVERALELAERDREEAINLLENYAASGQNQDVRPKVRLHAGELHRLNQNSSAAEKHFRRIKEEYPRHAAREGAVLGLALLEVERSGSGNAVATLKLVSESRAPDSMNADRYRALAILEREESGEANKEALEFAQKALLFSEGNTEQLQRIRAELAAYFPSLNVGETSPEEAGPLDTRALTKIRTALNENRLEDALRLLDRFAQVHPNSPFASTAEWMTKRAEAGNPWSPKKIGVLLPLSGQFAPAGNQIRAGLEQAILDRSSDVELVFGDTAGEAETAVSLMDKFLLEDGVAMLIGPLLKDVSFAIADIAQAAEIPMVSFSQAAGLTERGEWTFRGGLTKRQQIRSLLQHAVETQGIQRFAILAPDNAYGRDAATEFEAQATAMSAAISRTVFYDPSAPDMRSSAQELGQKLDESRQRELYFLRKDAKENGMDPAKVVLPPIVDFDAIFVPDGATRVPTVASALAYEEFAIGRFRPTRDQTPMPLLGLNGWNDPRLARQGGRYVLDGFFVDAFSLLNPTEGQTDFVTGFQETQGRPPGIFEAIAYDVASLADVALQVLPENRRALQQILTGVNLHAPITGGQRFDENRELERQLTLFTIGNEGIEVWQADEPETPAPLSIDP